MGGRGGFRGGEGLGFRVASHIFPNIVMGHFRGFHVWDALGVCVGRQHGPGVSHKKLNNSKAKSLNAEP